MLIKINRFAIYLLLPFLFLSIKTKAANKLYFSNIGISQGLPSNVTNSIVQDPAGFIWIGTDEGLCRFDGYKTITFKAPASQLTSNNISCLLYNNNTLWIGTWEGLCTINTQNFTINQNPAFKNKVIRCLFCDKQNQIWIGTSDGLFVYNQQLNSYKYYNTNNSNLSHNTIRTIYQTQNGNIYIGTYNMLNVFNNGRFKSFNLKGNYKPMLQNNLVLDIAPYNNLTDSLLWIGTETGLCLFNTNTGNYKLYNTQNTNLSNEIIKCIHTQNNTLWLGTDFGLAILDPKTNNITTYYHNPIVNYSVTNNVIWDIFTDNNNIIWLITSNGISLVNNNTNNYTLTEEFYSVNNQIAGNQIRDIIFTPDSTKYMATIHGVIAENKQGKKKYYTAAGPSHQNILIDNVYALLADNYNRVWIGTAGGINIFNPKTNTMQAITANKKNGLTSNYISSFALAKNGTLYVNTWEGGLFVTNANQLNTSLIKFKLIDSQTAKQIITIDNNLYCTNGQYLFTINNKTFTKNKIEAIDKHTNTKQINCINNDSAGNIYIVTELAIIKYNVQNQKIKTIKFDNTDDFKPQSIEIDNTSNIWVSTYNSVKKFDIDNGVHEVLPLPPYSPIKSFYPGCSSKNNNGTIYFGGDNGYITINPAHNSIQQNNNQVYISSLYINNQQLLPTQNNNIISNDIAYTQHITLNYNQNSVTFEFANANYWLPEKTRFKYKLQNYDQQWNYTFANQNTAVYPNLPPGKYVLNVESSNYNGLLINKSCTLQITIKPHFLLSNFFKFIYFLALTGLIYFVFTIYGYRQKTENKLRIAQLENQHAENLVQTKLQFFTNISHEFRTPLSLIAPPIKQVLEQGNIDQQSRQMLTLAQKNSRRLLQLVNQLLDFRKIEQANLQLTKTATCINFFINDIFNLFTDLASRNEIIYKLVFNHNNINCEIDTEKIETILFNLLSNAFKHTPVNGQITVSVNKNTNNTISISVTDNGNGISPADQQKLFTRFYKINDNKNGTGIGLALSYELAKLHGGNLTLVSQPNNGSTFTLTIPHLEPQHFINQTIYTATYNNYIPNNNMAINKPAKTLLVIDDNPDIVDYITMNLNSNYNILQAFNGQLGLELASKNKPDLIISDIMMPVINGLELCRQIKNNPATMHIPVILLTAKSLDEQKTEGMHCGANLYITKPFDANYLKSCVTGLFKIEQQMHQYITNKLLTKPQAQTNDNNNQDTIFVKKVMSIIETNIDDPALSVEFISKHIGISPTHLYRKMKQITNQPTKDIIKNYRITKAAQMLKNNEGNVTEIMYSVGFSSISSFSKSFKDIYGVPPAQYAKK